MPTVIQQTPIGGKLTSTQSQQLSTKELSALYDRIYDIADRLIKKHNPCKIHTKNKKLCCVDSPRGRWRLCCNNCFNEKIDHWSFFGCTVKCLSCKLYLCDVVIEKNKQLSNRLYRLKQFARKYGLVSISYYFMSKEQWLKQIRNERRRMSYGR